MKKILAVLLIFVLMFSFVACSGSDSDTADAEETTTTEVEVKNNGRLQVIDLPLTDGEDYAMAVSKENQELLEKVNVFLKNAADDGRIDKVFNDYFGDGKPEAVESAELNEKKDQLVVATCAGAEEDMFEYTDGTSYYGIDMEIAKLLAEELGKELVIVNMDFNKVVLSVKNGESDIAIAGLVPTKGRTNLVDFAEPYYNNSQKLVVFEGDTTFEKCQTTQSERAILEKLEKTEKIGTQKDSVGNYLIGGNEDWGWAAFEVSCVTYENSLLPLQEVVNGNVKYAVVDSSLAFSFVKTVNQAAEK